MVFKLVVVVVVGLYLEIPNRAILVILEHSSSQNLLTFVPVIVLADL